MEELSSKDYTKKYITTALFKLMKEKNYHDITISEIAKKAGVNRVTYYRNFESKDDIINCYFISTMKSFVAKFNFIPRCKEDYYDLIYSVFEGIKKNQEAIRLIMISKLDYLLLDFLNEHFYEAVKAKHVDNEYFAFGYAGAFYNMSLKWVSENCKTPLEDITKTMLQIITQDSPTGIKI